MSVTSGDISNLIGPIQYWPTHTVTYSFITDGSPPSYYTSGLDPALNDSFWGFGSDTTAADAKALGPNQQNAVAAAMAAWSSVANITFTPVASGTGQISLGQIPFKSGSKLQAENALAIGYRPLLFSDDRSGDLWLDSLRQSNRDQYFSGPGSSGYWLMLHELGHTLGIIHPGAWAKPTNNESANSWRYTVMSYRNLNNSAFADQGKHEGMPFAPMLLDIAAIQRLYGANSTTNAESGNTYRFKTTNGWPIQAIWDAGGSNDTIDGSDQTGELHIDLNAGGESYRSGSKSTRPEIHIAFTPLLLDGTSDPNYADNFIENAIGGTDDDEIIGNDGDNRLEGGNGKDKLIGGKGNDVLSGGLDDDAFFGLVKKIDHLEGGIGNDTYLYDKGDGQDVVTDGEGNNILVVNNVTLSNAGLKRTTNKSAPSRLAWSGKIGSDDIVFTLMSGSITVQNGVLVGSDTLVISGPALGDKGSITINNFVNGQFGLTLNPENTIQQLSGSSTLQEGLAIQVGMALAGFAGVGQVVRFAVNGLQTALKLVTGADTLSFNPDGTLDVTLEAGLTLFNYALVSQGDVDQDTPINLTATLLDANGNPIGTTSSLDIAFDAVEEATSSRTIAGDITIGDVDGNTANGTQVNVDDIGNIIGTSGTSNHEDQLYGSAGNDTIVGHALGDFILGLDGDDLIYADQEIDVESAIIAGAGGEGLLDQPYITPGVNDRMSGGTGDDIIVGSLLGDFITGGEGADKIIGGQGDDLLLGDLDMQLPQTIPTNTMQDLSLIGDGRSGMPIYISSDATQNKLSGGVTWNFSLSGGADQIYGGGGNDWIVSGGGNDFVFGGNGNDTINAGVGADTLLGGDGNDEISGDSYYYHAVTLVTDGGTDFTFTNDFLDGGNGDDKVGGDVGNDVVFGGQGNDELNGGSGNDYVNGELDNDLLVGLSGIDQLIGGLGDDRLYGDDYGKYGSGQIISPDLYGDDTLDGGDGNDTLYGDGGSDILIGGVGKDYLVGDDAAYEAVAGKDYLDGGDEDDTLWGEGGDDILLGGDGDDYVNGDGNTVSTAKQGDDYMDGGAGNDSMRGYGGTDTMLGGAGNDYLVGDDAAYEEVAGDDYLDGGDGDDTFWGEGGNDTLIGGAGNDDMNGDGNTVSAAKQGDDYMEGGAGSDTLRGYGGNDTLIGGTGDDYLYGGEGDDTYIYANGDGVDFITDHEGTNTLVMDSGVDAGEVSVSQISGNLVLSIEGVESTTQLTISDWNGGTQHALTSIEFTGMTWTAFDINLLLPGNQRPSYLNPLPQLSVERGQAFVFTLPSDAFVDPDATDILTLTATLSDGTPLPTWLSFDSLLNTFVGTPTAALGITEISIEATDLSGATITGNFEIQVNGTLPIVLQGTEFDDVLVASTSDDYQLLGFEGADSLTGSTGNDWLDGGDNDDVYQNFGIGSGHDFIVDTEGFDRLLFSTDQDIAIEQLQFSRIGTDLKVVISPEDSITVEAWFVPGDRRLEVLELSEQGLVYSYYADQIAALISHMNSAPRIGDSIAVQLGAANSHFSFQFNANSFLDVESQHALTYSASLANGGSLPAWLQLDSATRTFYGTATSGDIGTTQISVTATDSGGLSATQTFTLRITPAMIYGTQGDDLVIGTADANALIGLGGNDTLHGLDGNDELFGLDGDDTIDGGLGDDVLEGDADFNGVEGLGGNDQLYGATGNDFLSAGSGNDYLDGGAGIDALHGGLGNDIYVVNEIGDVVNENWNEGIDEVRSAITYRLISENYAIDYSIENLTLIGTAAINGTGNMRDNILIGNSAANQLNGLDGDDVIDGGAGRDVLIGWNGNDTFYVDDTYDWVSEEAGRGTDQVFSSASWTMNDNVEKLTLIGLGNVNGTGNALDNIIIGNSGNNLLDGKVGADTLIGGAGNDTYVVDNINDAVTELLGEGTDLVQSVATYVLGSQVENLTLTGANIIDGTGNELNNTLTGNSAANVLKGRLGNDIYYVGAGDTVIEAVNEGTDLIQSTATYTLGDHIEHLTLTGAAFINGIGNALDNILIGNGAVNTLTGNGGNDTLDGGAGNDILKGGIGNDIYIVDSGDTLTENPNEGTDTIKAGVAWTLATDFENLTLTGTAAINGTGNAVANIITGNSGNNMLDGKAGIDTLIGGAGNDTYVVDSTNDIVTEVLNEGTDLVQSSATFTLSNYVENLTLTGTAGINGAGNALNNILTGNSAVNTLTGGAGNDTYNVTAGDVVSESLNEGIDLVQSAVAFTLANHVENLTLTGTALIAGTGNALDNILIGNGVANTLIGYAGNDTLNGGAGIDKMLGGIGNDIYYVDVTVDVVTENPNEGIDVINTSITLTSPLAANVELLFLNGTGAINGNGNALANLLRGNTANNTLIGGGGNDILEGGAGNDILSNTTGNTLLNGGAGIDTLTGGSNNDLLIAGIGNDALTTGAGADIIAFNKGDGQDTIAISTVKDNTLSIGGGAVYADLVFQKSSNNLILKVGATDQITFTNYYAAAANRSVSKLQVVIEGTTDYVPGSTNVTKNNKIETFNFDGLVSAFDAARTANPALTSWALSGGLISQYLSGSDTAAIGGDLAYRYGRFGNLSDISFTSASSILAASTFGAMQLLQPVGGLQDSSPRLS